MNNAIYVVSFAITGTSMQKVKRRKKEKANISREDDDANIDSFIQLLPMSLFHRDCFAGWC
jgi:hypothetical protein